LQICIIISTFATTLHTQAILSMPSTTLPTKGCLISKEQGDLHYIHLPEYQIGVWDRSLPAELKLESEELLNSNWKEFRFTGPAELLSDNLQSAKIGLSLQTDLLALASWFARLVDNQPLRLYFGKVQKDMCRRFHTDINSLRLLCTYSGPGTLWVRPDAVDQSRVAKGTNEEMIKDPTGVHQANEGDVLLIKGALHESSQYGGALHRSPAVEEAGQSRLLLRIDTGSAFNFE